MKISLKYFAALLFAAVSTTLADDISMKSFDPSKYGTVPVADLQQNWTNSDDVVYTSSTNSFKQDSCRLSVFHPVNQTNTPVLVYFHGGGLSGGTYKECPELYKHLGCVLVSAEYRKYPEAKYPDFITDAAEALVWVKDNIRDYNGNPDMVFVSGHSAGAYITVMLALCPEFIVTASGGRYCNKDFRVYFSISGEMTTHYAVAEERGFPKGKIVIDNAAPIYNISPDTPPIFVITGDTDRDIGGRAADNKLFGDAMKRAGNKNISRYEVPGTDHGSIMDAAYAYMLSTIHSTTLKTATAQTGK